MPEAWDDYVLVGLITRPHGLRGEVKIRPETDFPEQRFAVGATVYARLDGEVVPLVVASSRTQTGLLLVSFEGRDRLEDVEALGLTELRVPESELVPLGEGEYYWFQLEGAPVSTEDGQEVGRVLRVEPTGGTGMLIVDGPDGEVQVPLVRDVCTTLTPERIVVRAPEGLLELNAPVARRTGRRRESRSGDDISGDGGGRPRRRGRRARRPARPD